jgi:protein-disulfide isomerase-like protein with CxxC motif
VFVPELSYSGWRRHALALPKPLEQCFHTMQQDQYQKGLATIRAEIDEVLADRGIIAAAIAVNEAEAAAATMRSATISITVNGDTQTETFTYDEIEDSGEAIDAPAAIKVRMLVSHFVR